MVLALHSLLVLCLTSGLWINLANCFRAGDCCETCPSSWTQYGRRCFIFYSAGKNWVDSEKTCIAVGGNLASIRNQDEYLFLRDLIYRATGQHKITWVGGYDAVKEGVWLWSDGSKFDFKGWAAGEPNNYGQENCMELNYGGNDYINDRSCKLVHAFVCAMDLGEPVSSPEVAGPSH